MVESISKIQQLLAESKFVEAQKDCEVLLAGQKDQESAELLELYFESLKAQSRPIPHNLVFSLVDKILPSKVDKANDWVTFLSKEKCQNQQRLVLSEIRIAEIKGKTEELYQLISRYQLFRIETSAPTIPDYVEMLIGKYFRNDFNLQLQKLVMSFMRADLVIAEKLITELILSCFERTSAKGAKDKLSSLYEVLKSNKNIYHLEIYGSLCLLAVDGVKEKKDYKKLIELVIYIEDFKLQALLLNILKKSGLADVDEKYAVIVRQHKDYSYVYFDKYFGDLKSYFYQKPQADTAEEKPTIEQFKFETLKAPAQIWAEEEVHEIDNEEILLTQLLKLQDFKSKELLDIAVSFMQSDLYLAARSACELSYQLATSGSEKLKASYLKVTCLLKIGDYRSALDVSFQALSISQTQNDVLSFLYSQAEAYLKLREYKNAKSVLKKILSIDAGYRLAKERLDQLNAL